MLHIPKFASLAAHDVRIACVSKVQDSTAGGMLSNITVMLCLDYMQVTASALKSQADDIELTEAAAVKAPVPISPEVQAMNAGLKEVANMLLHALPMTSQRRVKIEQGRIHHDITKRSQHAAVLKALVEVLWKSNKLTMMFWH